MRWILILLTFFLANVSFAQKSTLSPQELNRALGGVVDYDASLIHFFFDADELELMLANPQQSAASKTPVQYAVKGLDLPSKSVKPFSNAPVTPLEIESNDNHLALSSPNYVRGYILLKNDHTRNFRSYELYEQDGALLGKGTLARKKSIRVPWDAEGTINLMLLGGSGTQSFQFMTAP